MNILWGSFILKTIFITKYNKYFENNYNWLVYLLISFILVILASQRMPALMLSASLIILFLIEGKINLKSKISIFLISLLCLLLIFNYNSKIKKHYIDRTHLSKLIFITIIIKLQIFGTLNGVRTI